MAEAPEAGQDRRAMLSRAVRKRYLLLALLPAAVVWGCGNEPPSRAVVLPGAGAGGGASTAGTAGGGASMAGASTGGQPTCPQSSPRDGSPCTGTVFCDYPAPPVGCEPSRVTANCVNGMWRTTTTSAVVFPVPMCPPTLPAAGSSCAPTPLSGCSPPPARCFYFVPECVIQVSAVCAQGVWSVSSCEMGAAGGQGGAPSDAGAAGESAGGSWQAGGQGGAGG